MTCSRLLRVILATVFLCLGHGFAEAQSSPNWSWGYVPTAGEWNAWFASKQDTLGYSPVNKAGDVMSGKLTTAISSPASAGLNIPEGTAPTTPKDGDVWSTQSGFYIQINGATLTYSGTFALPTPVTGTVNSGGIPYFNTQTQMSSSGVLGIHQLVLGGGVGLAPNTLGTLGTGTQVLHGNATGNPTWSAVALGADVSGILPLANGGFGVSLAGTGGTVAGSPYVLSQASTGANITVSPASVPNAVTYAATQTGGDFGAKVNAACSALPASGGIVDARGLNGAQSMTTTIDCGPDTKPTTVLFPTGVVTATGGAKICVYANTHLYGQGASLDIQPATEFLFNDATTPDMTYCGSVAGGNPGAVSMVWKDFSIVNHTDGAWAVDGKDFQDGYFENIKLEYGGANTGIGFVVGGDLANFYCACYNVFQKDQFAAVTYGLRFSSVANKNTIYAGSYRNFHSGGAAIYFDGTGGEDSNVGFGVDIESSVAAGVEFGGVADQMIGTYLEGNTTGILVDANATGNWFFLGGGLPGTITDNAAAAGNYDNFIEINSFNGGAQGVAPYFQTVAGYYAFGGNGQLGQARQTTGIVVGQGDNTAPMNAYFQVATANGSLGADYYGHSPFHTGQFVSFGGAQIRGATITTALLAPTIVSVTQHGTPGSTSASYYAVCIDWTGTKTTVSSVGTTTTGNATLSVTNYNQVNLTPQDGCSGYDILKADTVHSIFTNKVDGKLVGLAYNLGTPSATLVEFDDTGQASTSYVTPTRNATADLTLATGGIINAGISPGVTCSGSPTSSFASVGGVVTHC